MKYVDFDIVRGEPDRFVICCEYFNYKNGLKFYILHSINQVIKIFGPDNEKINNN